MAAWTLPTPTPPRPGPRPADGEQYAALRDKIAALFNPEPDPALSEADWLTLTLEYAQAFILSRPCTCDTQPTEIGACHRCTTVGRVNDIPETYRS